MGFTPPSTGGGSSPFVVTNEYWIDADIVDSPTFAALRMFSLIDLALADINGGSIPPNADFVIRCREEQNHVWDGTGFLADRSGTIYVEGGTISGDGTTNLDVSAAGLTIADLSEVSLTFRNLTITGVGVFGILQPTSSPVRLEFLDCELTDLPGSTVTHMTVKGASKIANSDFAIFTRLSIGAGSTVENCSFGHAGDEGGATYAAVDVQHVEVRWPMAAGATFAVNITGGTIANNLTDDSIVWGGDGPDNVAVTLTGTTIIATLDNVAANPSYLFQGADAVLNDVSIIANATDPDALLYLFSDPGTGTSAVLNDVRFAHSGAGSVGYETGGVVTTNNGFVVLGTALGGQPSGTYYNNGAGFVAVEP